MKKLGKELDFISWINRDGSGVSPVKDRLVELMQDDLFGVTCLSITDKTYIASGFNSFVVRMKEARK